MKGKSVSPDEPESMSAEDLRAMAQQDGQDAIGEAMRREQAMFGQALLNQQAVNGYHKAKASAWSAFAFLLLVIAFSIPPALWALL